MLLQLSAWTKATPAQRKYLGVLGTHCKHTANTLLEEVVTHPAKDEQERNAQPITKYHFLFENCAERPSATCYSFPWTSQRTTCNLQLANTTATMESCVSPSLVTPPHPAVPPLPPPFHQALPVKSKHPGASPPPPPPWTSLTRAKAQTTFEWGTTTPAPPWPSSSWRPPRSGRASATASRRRAWPRP